MSRNVTLGGGGGTAGRNSGEADGALGRVGVRGGVQPHLGLVCDRSWGGGATGSGAHRCQAAAAMVAWWSGAGAAMVVAHA
jgi:hypothetical protein